MANAPASVKDPSAADAAASKNGALWYAFQGDGRSYLIKPGTVASTEAGTNGFHGYPTIEDALSNPNTTNSATGSTVSGWAQAASAPVGGGTFGVLETVSVTWSNGRTGTANVSTPQNPDTSAASNATGINAIGDFFSGLTQRNLWLRVAMLVGGGVILVVGIAKMTGIENKAINVAAKAIPLV